MATADSTHACQQRHINYEFDVREEAVKNHEHLARLKQMAAWAGSGRVLDIGCNTGMLADLLKPGSTYTGVDIAPAMVARAQAHGLNALVGVAEDLPFPDGSFDAAVLGEILEHVFDPALVVEEAARVAPVLVGSVPTDTSRWGTPTVARHTYHVRAFTRSMLRATLERISDRYLIAQMGQFFYFKMEV